MSYGYGGFEGDVDDQHSIPLEITLYMVGLAPPKGLVAHAADLSVPTQSAFVAELQKRKVIDVPTTSEPFFNLLQSRARMTLPSHKITSDSMLAGINVFTDTLAHLERILTTPIPFSYQAHIYEVSWLYCLLLVSMACLEPSIKLICYRL